MLKFETLRRKVKAVTRKSMIALISLFRDLNFLVVWRNKGKLQKPLPISRGKSIKRMKGNGVAQSVLERLRNLKMNTVTSPY